MRMLKKGICCILLSFLLCFAIPAIWSAVKSGITYIENGLLVSAESSQAAPEQRAEEMREVVVYYRFGNTRWLSPVRMQIDLRREDTIATTLVRQLIAGPEVTMAHLSGLFPPGTRLISVLSDGTTAFVTLNRAFLDRPDNAPADWEDNEFWQKEATLRRAMALQSIVLSLTEEGQTQRVQLFVADEDDEIGRRLPLAWFDSSVTDPEVFLGACGRDESICLTAHNTLSVILGAWQQHDWTTLSLFLRGAISEKFAVEMEEQGIELLAYSVSPGNISLDGQKATLVVDGKIRTGSGETIEIERESVLLVRSETSWQMDVDALNHLMVRD